MNETIGTIFTVIVVGTLFAQLLEVFFGKASVRFLVILAVFEPVGIGLLAWLFLGMGDMMWRMTLFALIITLMMTMVTASIPARQRDLPK